MFPDILIANRCYGQQETDEYDIALLKTRKQMKAVSPKVEDQPPARAAEHILKWGAEFLMCKSSSIT